MIENDLPSLQDAIKIALDKAKTISFGGFKYILLQKGEPKHLYTKQKAEYKRLKKLFYGSKNNSWEHPFRKYDVSTAYIAQTLKILKKQGKIQKKDNYYFISEAYKNSGKRAHNKAILDNYSLEMMYTPPDPLDNHQNKTITIYGLNNEIINHAKQIQMDKILEKKINILLNTASQINELKHDIEEMFKLHLFITKCEQHNDPKLNQIALGQIDKFLFLLTVPAVIEKISYKPYGYHEYLFDRKKTEQELEQILLSLTKSKRSNKKRQTSHLLSEKQKKILVDILESIYNDTAHIYNQPDQTYLTSIIIDHAPIRDEWDTSAIQFLIEKLKEKYTINKEIIKKFE